MEELQELLEGIDTTGMSVEYRVFDLLKLLQLHWSENELHKGINVWIEEVGNVFVEGVIWKDTDKVRKWYSEWFMKHPTFEPTLVKQTLQKAIDEVRGWDTHKLRHTSSLPKS